MRAAVSTVVDPPRYALRLGHNRHCKSDAKRNNAQHSHRDSLFLGGEAQRWRTMVAVGRQRAASTNARKESSKRAPRANNSAPRSVPIEKGLNGKVFDARPPTFQGRLDTTTPHGQLMLTILVHPPSSSGR
jgi:hypothetical protein